MLYTNACGPYWTLPLPVDTKISEKYNRRRRKDEKERHGTACIHEGNRAIAICLVFTALST
jgi:hypothetical protein